MAAKNAYERISTGVSGLDEVLHGGLPEDGVFLVTGGPGTGKTTLGLQFLLDGVSRGESALFVSLAQPTRTLERVAASHGWSLEGVHVHAIRPGDLIGEQENRQDVLVSDEIELADLTARIRRIMDDVEPDRVVFDSLSLLQILSTVPGRFRQELITLTDYLQEYPATCLMTSATDGEFSSTDAEIASDGMICLHHVDSDYGGQRSRLMVRKLRASDFRGGFHDFDIVAGGLKVFPRVVPLESGEVLPRERYESGVAELDALVGGGLAAGTSCLIIGPSGCGKTSLATQYIAAAARNGKRAAILLFDEARETFLRRAADLGMDLQPHIDAGTVIVQQVEGALVSPGEFSVMVRDALDENIDMLVIDSLTGYFQSMPEEHTLLAQVRDLIRYMNRRGVLSIMTVAQRGLVGQEVRSPLDISESVDTALLLRYFEMRGKVRKAISVIKKRYGRHEADIRELLITEEGLQVGSETRLFSGILSGSPRFEGEWEELMEASEPDSLAPDSREPE